MSVWSELRDLPLRVEGHRLEPLSCAVSPEFTRRTTVVVLSGAGEEGVGEDVTYTNEDQERFQRTGAALPFAGEWTLASFSAHLDGVALFEAPPDMEASHDYRRWAVESAALDLALRQAGTSLAGVVGREPRPVRFGLSMRLRPEDGVEPVRQWLAIDPNHEFKLDVDSWWDDAVVAALARFERVVVVDLKGFYSGTPVDTDADPELYARVAAGLPSAWLEDALVTDATRDVLATHQSRLSWDAPIHRVADLEAMAFQPVCVNIKPSRSGRLEDLFALYEHVEERELVSYGGGQFELGPGRGQIQLLASLFHPDGPNDVAPAVFHTGGPIAGRPTSPLAPAADALGFRWSD